MAIARASSGTQFVVQATYVNTLDLTTLTVDSGTNLALFAGLIGGQGLPSSISANWDQTGTPQAMTSITSVDTSSGDARVALFYLVSPTTGNKTLRFTWTGLVPATLGAAAFSDVNQTTPYASGDTLTNTNTSDTPSSGAITSSGNDATLAIAGAVDTATANRSFTTSENFTSEWRQTTGGETAGSMTSELGGTSNNHSFTINVSDAWAVIGIHIKSATVVPIILTQPLDQAAIFGNTATFTVEASSATGTTLSYQWTQNGSNVGSNASSFSTSQTQNSRFAVSVWDVNGTTQSGNAYLRLTYSSGAYALEITTSDRYQLQDGSGNYLIEPWGAAGTSATFGPFFVGVLNGLGSGGRFHKNRLH